MFTDPTFQWFVSEPGYCWKSVILANGQTERRLVRAESSIDSDKREWWEKEFGVLSSRPYEPLHYHPGLFRVLAAAEPTERGILAFANRFGRLLSADPS